MDFIMCLVLCAVGAWKMDPLFFVAAGIFSLSGNIWSILNDFRKICGAFKNLFGDGNKEGEK